MDLKGSQTERNLVTAFVGESVARNRYTFFASQAKNDGYIQIAQIFEETANQEKEHGKRFFKSLQGGEVKIECGFPAGIVGTTLENLSAAANGENEEWSALYPTFAAKAREEGFKTIGVMFDMVSVAESRVHDIVARAAFREQEPKQFLQRFCIGLVPQEFLIPSHGHQVFVLELFKMMR